MSNDKEKKLRKREKAFDLVYFMVFGLVIVIVSIYYYHFNDHRISLDPEDWGVFGDFMGGTLNPLLAFFSFMLLLLTLKLQREQLDKTEEQLELNREELKLTREELRKSANAQVDSAKVMNEQLKTQYLQQFESFFFDFLEHISKKLEFLMDSGRVKEACANIFNPKIRKSHSGRQFMLLDHQEVMILFNMLFELLNHIDQSTIDAKQKDKYINIVKCLLPQDVLGLLMVLGQEMLYGRDFKVFREIIEKYALLENIKFYERNIFKTSLLLTISQKYNKCAFGGSVNFKQVQGSILYKDFEEGKSFFVILYLWLEKHGYVGRADWQKQKYIVINGENKGLKFSFGVDKFEHLVDRTTVRITTGYLNDCEITDFRLEEDIIHFKIQEKWQTAIYFKEKKVVRLSSRIVDERYFDNYVIEGD